MTGWVVIADDLTGALDAAAALAPGAGGRVLLAPDSPWPAPSGLVAVSTRTRDDDPGATAHRVAQAVGLALERDAAVLLKIDSLLRGEVGAAVRAGLDAWRARHGACVAIVAPAFPARGRRTRNGRVEVEGEQPPERCDLMAVLAAAGLRSLVIGRGEPLPSVGSLVESAGGVDALILDGESDDDLARVAAAYAGHAGVLLVGTAGLAAQLAAPGSRDVVVAAPVGDHVLLAIGSLAPAVLDQVQAVIRAGVPHIPVGDAPAVAGGKARELLRAGHVILTPGLGTGLADGDPRVVARRLADAVADAASEADALVLSGGHTAQAVLDRLGVPLLEIVTELEPGIVASRMPGRQQLVVTKAGAFGDAQTLLRLLTPSVSSPNRKERLVTEPLVAITMGDPAGVGPEIIAKAMTDPDLHRRARVVVIGSASRLQQAVELTHGTLGVHAIDDLDDAHFDPAQIDCLDVPGIGTDLPWGELSAEAGHAAYLYIEKAVALATAGRIDAICTAPLNKAALHLAGHRYPGHTELLAELTGTPEVSMMLTAPRLRVIHVTTHIGLIDAIERIDGDLVFRTIARGHELLTRMGIAEPKVGVCAINPHAGENGLFGRGEEAEKIVPGIEQARRAGIDAVGPLPADTLFFRAGRGEFDLVVAMYHDQGHGPVKVLGIENGVNVTVGLPVVRTSVDHGTAFDIAGKNLADHASMLEALRQAVDLSATR